MSLCYLVFKAPVKGMVNFLKDTPNPLKKMGVLVKNSLRHCVVYSVVFRVFSFDVLRQYYRT